jgi:hypothetical protein
VLTAKNRSGLTAHSPRDCCPVAPPQPESPRE